MKLMVAYIMVYFTMEKRFACTAIIAMVMFLGFSQVAGFALVEETPKWGGTFVYPLIGDAPTLMFNIKWDAASCIVAAQMGEHLVEADQLYGEGFRPSLATSWEISTDLKVYTMHLRKNVTFHDGHVFTSHDVRVTIEGVVTQFGTYASKYAQIAEIVTPDDYTVIFNLKRPNAVFLYDLGNYDAPLILPAHLYNNTDWLKNPYNMRPVYTGPYMFKEWVLGEKITLVRYDDHWSTKAGINLNYFDKIIYRLLGTAPAILLALEKNEAQYHDSIGTYADSIRIRSGNPNVRIDYAPVLWMVHHVQFNLLRPPFNDIRVRRAMIHAVNLTRVSELASSSICPPIYGAMQVNWAYNANVSQPEYDPAKAETLLDQAGYPRGEGGVRFSVSLKGVSLAGVTGAYGNVLKEMWRQVGVEVSLIPSTGTWSDEVFVKHDFDLSVVGGTHGPDPNEWAIFIETGGYRNGMNYSNARVDELFTLGRSTANQTERKKYYWEIQEIIGEDVPRLNLCLYMAAVYQDAHFKDYYCNAEAKEKGLYQAGLTRVFKGIWWTGGSTRSPYEVAAAIEKARGDIEKLDNEGWMVTTAYKKLDECKEMLDKYGNYDECYVRANAALSFAQQPGTNEPEGPALPYELVGVAIAVVVALVAIPTYWYRKSKAQKRKESVVKS